MAAKAKEKGGGEGGQEKEGGGGGGKGGEKVKERKINKWSFHGKQL